MSPVTTERSTCVLLVKPEEKMSQSLCHDVQESGYEAVITTELVKGLGLMKTLTPAMVVIDQTQTGEAGFKFCRQLRSARYRLPILMVMAQETVDDRVACLEAGADDYLLKPYRSEMFLDLLQLYLQPSTPTSEQLRFGNLILDLTTRRAIRNNREFDLTAKEFELLRYLMQHPREVVTREQILENVWGYDFMGESNVIEVYIRYLRLKIEDEGEKRLIQTVRGVGYVLREP
ncbi:response regulator transcription factor [Spirulina sp. CS-785/01]|uniref:response regulator transcription factor NblR n=1 Tax=Spirulina sp. CS-785/01 TaxID=3021716 RepID=UPI00232C8D1A|nr:response regulator transcription factor [Spirulina sp. CS-785/01]MDB9315747.1 response regulator transcription factor [Spirulina sp. CS-785/01]